MAHFIGKARGSRSEASRLGSKASGMMVYAASWKGGVSVNLWYNHETEIDMVEVRLTPHHGAGSSRLLYRGPVSGIGGDKEAGAAA